MSTVLAEPTTVVAVPADADEEVEPRRPSWVWPFALFAFVQYALVGWWLLFVRNYMISDAISRSLAAKLVVLSRDPHLGAMGFYWMPIPTLARIPFVLLTQPFGAIEMAGPLTTAAFAALTLPVLHAIGRTLRISSLATGAIVVFYALNPLVMFIAANGMSEAVSAFAMALVMLAFFRWRADATSSNLMLLGLALAFATACRYETLVLLPIFAVGVMLHEPKGRRFMGAAVAMFPPVLVFLWWTLASHLIMNDGLFWLTASRATTATPENAVWLPAERALTPYLGYSATLVLAIAPAVVVVIGGCVLAPRQWRTSIVVLGVILALPAVVTLQAADGSSWAVPRFYALTPLLATIGVQYVLSLSRQRAGGLYVVGWIGVVAVGLGAVTGTLFLGDPRRSHAEGEFALLGPLIGTDEIGPSVDDSGEGRVFIGDLRPFRRLRADLDPELAKGRKVAMDSLQAVPALITAYPKQFIVPEDRDFEQIVADPQGRFDFIIVQPRSAATGFSVSLKNELGRSGDGSWELVGEYDGWAELYEWVPTEAAPPPTAAPDARS